MFNSAFLFTCIYIRGHFPGVQRFSASRMRRSVLRLAGVFQFSGRVPRNIPALRRCVASVPERGTLPSSRATYGIVGVAVGAVATTLGFYSLDRTEPRPTLATLNYADKATMLKVCRFGHIIQLSHNA